MGNRYSHSKGELANESVRSRYSLRKSPQERQTGPTAPLGRWTVLATSFSLSSSVYVFALCQILGLDANAPTLAVSALIDAIRGAILSALLSRPAGGLNNRNR